MAEENLARPNRSPLRMRFMEFVDNVGIAGLPEAFESTIYAVQIMFRISLLAAFGGMAYEAYTIILQYMEEGAVLNTLKMIDDQPPFPNVSICYPNIINERIWNETSAPIYENDQKVIGYMKRHNLTREDVVTLLRRTLGIEVSLEDAGRPIYRLTKMVFDRTQELSASKVSDDFITSLNKIPCELALTNCSMNGVMFDCCQAARIMYKMPFGTCYHIQSINVTKGEIDRKDAHTLVVNVSMNWTYGFFADGIASDGFEIFIHMLPLFVKIPIFVPSGMDVSVVLEEPKKLNQVADCIPNDEAPELKYFDYYDTEGIQCLQEFLTDLYLNGFGCTSVGGFYVPEHPNCTFETTFIAFVGMIGTFDDDAAFKKMETERAGTSNDMTSPNKSPCKPLCSRWSYPVLSTSYAAIYDHNGSDAGARSSITSWSLVKIVMPHNTYTYEVDQERSVWYLALCDVSGMMGVYAGFSMITFAQILFYGLNLIISRRKHVVHPAL